jgi:hypothetical protein
MAHCACSLPEVSTLQCHKPLHLVRKYTCVPATKTKEQVRPMHIIWRSPAPPQSFAPNLSTNDVIVSVAAFLHTFSCGTDEPSLPHRLFVFSLFVSIPFSLMTLVK